MLPLKIICCHRLQRHILSRKILILLHWLIEKYNFVIICSRVKNGNESSKLRNTGAPKVQKARHFVNQSFAIHLHAFCIIFMHAFYFIFMSLIVLYFLHSISVLSFYIDVVLTLSITLMQNVYETWVTELGNEMHFIYKLQNYNTILIDKQINCVQWHLIIYSI